MTDTRPPYTHDAYLFRTLGARKGRRLGVWINEGEARVEPDGDFTIHLHSTPIGSFDGRIVCRRKGKKPPELAPQRPGDDAGDEGDGDEAEG